MKKENNNPPPEMIVSVCTITYKHASFIKDTIEGVLLQEVNFPIEFIIADDNSPDDTAEIVKHYQENHPKGHWINYTKHDDNKGMMENFIWALKECKGKYIALCEGDDYWTDPLKLQQQVDFLESNADYVACFHDAMVINEKELVIRENKFSKINLHDYNFEALKSGRVIPTLTNVFRNVIADIPEEFSQSGLGDKFLSSFLGNYGNAKYLKGIKPAVYRVGNHGIWSQQNYVSKKKLNLMTVYQLWRYYDRMGDHKSADILFNNLVIQGYRLYPYLPSGSILNKIEKGLLKLNYNFFKFLKLPGILLAKLKLWKHQ